MTKRELTRNAARRLAIIRHAQEVSGNVAQTCRYFGITRQAHYTWLRRYEELGPDGLRDRSHRPLVSPNATKPAVIDRIVYLRQNYHFGPQKISMYLKRYHEITVSQSGVWRILRRLDLDRVAGQLPRVLSAARERRSREDWRQASRDAPSLPRWGDRPRLSQGRSNVTAVGVSTGRRGGRSARQGGRRSPSCPS